MNELSINNTGGLGRSAELIAVEINSIKGQTRRMVLYNSIEIGRRLVEAKALVPHGEWGDWLKNSVDYSKSTANNLMRIFQEYGSEQITLLTDNAKIQALGNLSYTQAVALLGLPAEERESFIQEHDMDSMSTRELQQAIKEKEQLLKEKEELAKKLEDAQEATKTAEKLRSEKEKAEANAKALQDALHKEKSKSKEEIDRLQSSIEEMKRQLSEAHNSGNHDEVDKLQKLLNNAECQIEEANKKVDELEQKLKEKPIEVVAHPEVIEKVPEEVEKELKELREKVKQSSGPDVNQVKFKIQFDELSKSLKELLSTLAVIEDEEIKSKYKGAIKKLINMMGERL